MSATKPFLVCGPKTFGNPSLQSHLRSEGEEVCFRTFLGWPGPPLRASNEGILRPRVARAPVHRGDSTSKGNCCSVPQDAQKARRQGRSE